MRTLTGEERTEALRYMAYSLIREFGHDVPLVTLNHLMFMVSEKLKDKDELDVGLPYAWGVNGVWVDWSQIPGVEMKMNAVGEGGISSPRPPTVKTEGE
jgi:hypothetical protein